jgi:predicted HicB family RNase H-like nuclease
MSNSDYNGLSRLERLAVLMRTDGVEPEAMSSQQLDDYLKAHKVDMTEPQKRFDYLLKQAKMRRRLELARERRLKAVEQAKSVLSTGTAAVEAVRARVQGMLGKLQQRDPDQALVYAREFEKATPEDWAVFEEDLLLLELEGEDHASGNQ